MTSFIQQIVCVCVCVCLFMPENEWMTNYLSSHFRPSLDPDQGEGFFELVEGLLFDAYAMSSLIPHVAKENNAEHYQVRYKQLYLLVIKSHS